MGWYLLVSPVFFLTAVWVWFDANKKGARNPGGWVLAVSLIWIVMFPLYLWKRGKFSEVQGESQNHEGIKVWVAIPLAAVIASYPYIKAAINYYQSEQFQVDSRSVPECNDEGVIAKLSQLVGNGKIEDPVEIGTDSDTGTSVRSCKAIAWNSVVGYSVSWYDDQRTRYVISFQ